MHFVQNVPVVLCLSSPLVVPYKKGGRCTAAPAHLNRCDMKLHQHVTYRCPSLLVELDLNGSKPYRSSASAFFSLTRSIDQSSASTDTSQILSTPRSFHPLVDSPPSSTSTLQSTEELLHLTRSTALRHSSSSSLLLHNRFNASVSLERQAWLFVRSTIPRT